MYVLTTASAPPTPIAYSVFHASSGQKLLENAISQMKPPANSADRTSTGRCPQPRRPGLPAVNKLKVSSIY
jgi:hypothetical protein